ncbi:hypothetical protein N7450_001760 [Penicillium hetheringtonii]|uniref:Lysine-specific metallo-endopeptidase domain-containing protein n=1 Tax=Penicillium hetheringtonii TaxID=911720 RepID=A0AAD6H2P0_9EURO|nr:hypothetical protein N7450_001760 [Penicillium hetheringtonii]
MASLAWIGILICVLPHTEGHAHGYHHRHLNKRFHGAHFNLTKRATVSGRSNIFVDDSSCTNYVSSISQVFDNVMTIVTAAKNAIPALEGTLGAKRQDLTSAQKSKLDLFMSLYGKFDNEDLGEVYTAKDKLDTFSSFLGRYVDAMSSNSFDIDIYCGDNNWQKTGKSRVREDEDGNEARATVLEYQFLLKNVMEADEIWDEVDNLCQETEKDEHGDPYVLAAFTTESVNNNKDFVTICDNSWDDWEYQLPSKKAGALAGLKGEFLDDLLSSSPEATFLHELTHAKSVFGDNLMDDIEFKVNDDENEETEETAYKFEMCHELAKQDESKTETSQIRPLRNAGEIIQTS